MMTSQDSTMLKPTDFPVLKHAMSLMSSQKLDKKAIIHFFLQAQKLNPVQTCYANIAHVHATG